MVQNSFGKESFSLRVGKRLRRELRNRNLTQEQFSEMVCVDVRTVRRWIGSGIDSLDTIGFVASCLGVDAEDIIFGEDDVPFLFLKI